MTKSEISKIIESLKQYINEILGGYTTKEKEVAKFELDCMSNYADKMPLLQGTFRMFLRRFYYDAESLFRLEEMDDPNLYNLGTIVQYIGKTTYDPNLSIEQNPFPCYANGLFYQVTCKGIINTKKFDSIGVEFDSELIGRFLMFNNGLDTEINAYNYTIIPMGEINGKYHWGLGRIINGSDSTEIIYVFSSKEEMEFAGIKGFYGITESEYLSMFDESNPDDYPVFMYHTTSDRYWKLIDVQISSKTSAKSIQLSELPLDASYLGKICQYVGETTEQYTHGYFYKCVGSSSNDSVTNGVLTVNDGSVSGNVLQLNGYEYADNTISNTDAGGSEVKWVQIDVQPSAYLTDIITQLNNKVDKVDGKDLSTNDYTTAEKNKLAGLSNYDDSELLELIGDKANKVPTVDGGSGAVSMTIEPNKLYVFGECTSLNITFANGEAGIRNEYMFEFESGTTATTLTLPEGIKWILDIVIDPNYKYQVSIVNEMAIYGRVAL